MGYTPDYWTKNGSRIAEQRRKKYQNDPEYRSKVMERSREYREQKAAELAAFKSDPYIVVDGNKQKAFTQEGLCEHLGITPERLKYLRKSGYIPPITVKKPCKLYTKTQAALIGAVETFLVKNSKQLRLSKGEAGEAVHSALDAIITTTANKWNT